MAKMIDYELKGLSQEVIDFKDDILTILNYGKYQNTVVTSTPTWEGDIGETVYVIGGVGSSGVSQWVYVGTAWLATSSRG